jgi:hypothetical protein
VIATPLPLHRCKVAIPTIASNRDDATFLLLLLQALGDLQRAVHVGARRVPDVQPLFSAQALGHLPAVLGSDGQYLIRYGGIVDRRLNAGGHMLQPLQPVQRLRRFHRDAVHLA